MAFREWSFNEHPTSMTPRSWTRGTTRAALQVVDLSLQGLTSTNLPKKRECVTTPRESESCKSVGDCEMRLQRVSAGTQCGRWWCVDINRLHGVLRRQEAAGTSAVTASSAEKRPSSSLLREGEPRSLSHVFLRVLSNSEFPPGMKHRHTCIGKTSLSQGSNL